MALPSAKISVAVSVPVAVVRIEGRAASERSRDFKLALQRLASTGVREVFLDLSGCLLMDSMFSGVLSNLALHGGLRFTLVDANERILDLMDNLGALPHVRILRAEEGAPCLGPAEELAALPLDKRAVTELCLEAHRFLMELKAENRAKFATLETFLEAELKSLSLPATPVPPPNPVPGTLHQTRIPAAPPLPT
jgi:anti-anti-sigma regulatory factor